jgi:hypothetical protein
MKFEEIARLPADPLLADELLKDDGIIEMANLDKSQTGIDGVIWISTMMTGHAPRVKYFVRPGRTQSSFSVTHRRSTPGSREQLAAAGRQPNVVAGRTMGNIE